MRFSASTWTSPGQIKETYLFFCRALFDVIFKDLIAADILNPPQKTPMAPPGVVNWRRLNPGWHLTFTMGPIYLLQEVLEPGPRLSNGTRCAGFFDAMLGLEPWLESGPCFG